MSKGYKIKKGLLTGIIITSIALSSASTVSLANNTYNNVSFTDVKSEDWFHDSVVESAKMGLLKGKDTGKFDPRGDLTLAEAISLAARVNTLKLGGSVPEKKAGEAWYQGSVNYAKQKKIIGNNYEGRYNNPATRSEMAQIFASALPVSHYTQLKPVVNIPDVGTKDTNYIYIQQLYRAGIVVGSNNGAYKPSENISRAETAAILQRLIDETARNKDQVVVKPTPTPQPQKPVVTPQKPTTPPTTSQGATVYVSDFRGSLQTVSSNPSPNLNKIVTRYGRHTYGARNQQEYDYIMRELDAAYNHAQVTKSSHEERLERYQNGERDVKLNNFYKNYSFLLTDFTPENSKRVILAEKTGGALHVSSGGNNKSLYNLLKGEGGDCTALAYMTSAAYDRLGFNTRMVHSATHGWVEVEIDGVWWCVDGSIKPGTKPYKGILVGETYRK